PTAPTQNDERRPPADPHPSQPRAPPPASPPPPLAPDLHTEVEKHPRVEEPLELLAGGSPDAFDHLAAAADDDRLLRLALDDDGAVQLENSLRAVRLLEPIDQDGARKRYFLARQLQQLLA